MAGDPIWTESAAHARAVELLRMFDRDPDVLAPDEQALVMAIRLCEQAARDVLAERERRDAMPLKADGAWCINCFRPFGPNGVRYYFGANDVGPFCEACDRVIKVHTLFRGETTSRQ